MELTCAGKGSHSAAVASTLHGGCCLCKEALTWSALMSGVPSGVLRLMYAQVYISAARKPPFVSLLLLSCRVATRSKPA